jgi:nucleoid DNA-binding protein
MNEKINLQELTTLLATQAGITKKEAETFIKEWVDTINEGLLKDGLVKIKNLGTFKLSTVSDRESIDVATGERVLIAAHYKVSYTPDNTLAQAINEPFAFLEPVELTDEEAAEEISDTTTETIEETVEVVEEPAEQEEDAEDAKEPLIYTPQKHKKRRKKKLINWGFIFCLLVIAFILAIFYYIDLEKKNASATHYPEAGERIISDYTPSPETIRELNATLPDTIQQPTEAQEDSMIVKSEPISKPTPESVKTANTPVQKRTVKKGDRLALYALEAYGNRCFWVYIYEENKRILKDPNKIPLGKTIVIPPASKYGIDVKDEASVKKATELANQYNARKKW